MPQQVRRQGHDFIDLNQDGINERLQDPEYLVLTTQAYQRQPGLLGQLFGGGEHSSCGHSGGGVLSSPLAKGS